MMMSSVATQPKLKWDTLFSSKNVKSQNSLSPSFSISPLNPTRNLAPFAVAVASSEETSLDDSPPLTRRQKKKLGRVPIMKPMEKLPLVLKFIWMEKNLGIGLDQVIPGHGTVPLSPYYFWPRKDAWEELKNLLESKPWMSQKKMVILLNQATDIINFWQQSGGDLA